MKYQDAKDYMFYAANVSEVQEMLGKLKKMYLPWDRVGKKRHVIRNLEGYDVVSILQEEGGRWRLSGLDSHRENRTYRCLEDAKNAANHRLMVAGYRKVANAQKDTPVSGRLALLMEDSDD